jgi:hypothetical protein
MVSSPPRHLRREDPKWKYVEVRSPMLCVVSALHARKHMLSMQIL